MAPSRDDPPTATLSPQILAQIKSVQIRSRRLASLDLTGEWRSAFKGRGMEFDEVREYAPGDDVRTLDWNVTARSGIPHVKVYREERELTVMLLVDLSRSGEFGTGQRLKKEVIAEVSAVLAYTAIRNNDRVGLLTFTDAVESYVAPKKGRAHVWRVIRSILTAEARGTATNIGAALEHLGQTHRRSAVAFVVSDFLGQGWQTSLRMTARKHDVTAVTVTDPRERDLPPVGLMDIEDAETGERRLVNTASEHTRRQFYATALEHERRRDHEFRASGVGHIPIRTDRPSLPPILRFFRGR